MSDFSNGYVSDPDCGQYGGFHLNMWTDCDEPLWVFASQRVSQRSASHRVASCGDAHNQMGHISIEWYSRLMKYAGTLQTVEKPVFFSNADVWMCMPKCVCY